MANKPEPPTVSISAREIFLRALETTDPTQRTTLLDVSCGKNHAVRHEVEALLRESHEIGDFLQSPAHLSPRNPPKVGIHPLEATIKESTGDHIGPFELLEPLGEGGCGTVYMAEQKSPVRRRVALKIIKLGMDTKSVIARFESERQALAMMDHPNIAKVFDAGATDTGRPYFVMELVRGVPITDYCDTHRLATTERLALFIQVSNAIQHAHQKGIIHRDIKPSNILVGHDEGPPAPKVIDFGIAKATEQRLTERTLFTAFESFIGTPSYMSPEQAEIGGLDIDTRSDIYSLGVLLYELLVGRTPFDAAELQRLPIDEIRRTIRENEPDRPSSKLASLQPPEQLRIAECHSSDPAKLATQLRGDLDWIVIRCLEKDRSRRYATASDLISDIQRYLNSEPVLARPPSTIYRTRKLFRRHGAAIAASSLLLATLLAGIAISTTQAFRATRAEHDAEAGRIAQVELRAKAEQALEQSEANAAAASLNEYVADINLTHIALSEGNFGRASQLINKHRPSTGRPDHRGFEWRYLSKLCLGDRHLAFPNQGGSIQCIAFSPDGETLAVGLPDQLRLWNVRSRSPITSLPGGASSILFLPDGHTLVSSSRDTTWVLNTTNWDGLTELSGNAGPLVLSADGSQLATSSRDGIRIWDTTNWFELLRLPGASGPRAFSPDGKTLAATSDRGITLWSLADGRATITLADSTGLFDGASRDSGNLAFSADGRQIIAPRNSPSKRGVFILSRWDAATGDEIGSLPNEPGHTGTIAQLDVNPQRNLLATASWDHSVGLWDITSNSAITHLSGHRSEVWCVAISPGGDIVASGSKDGDLRLWPTTPQPERDSIPRGLVPLTFSQDGRQLAAGGQGETIDIFHLPGLELARSFPAGPSASLSADLSVLARGMPDGRIEILDTATLAGRPLQTSAARIDFLALTPDGKTLFTHDWRQPMQWWDLDDLAQPALTLAAESASISADGTTLAAFGIGGRVEVWNIPGRRKLAFLTIPLSFGSGAALSPEGHTLATTAGFSDSDNLISLWDTRSGLLIGTFAGHKQDVRSVAFSPDGRTLASSSNDGTLKLWNVATQQELLSIRRLGASMRNLAFSPDGQWLAASNSPDSPDGELRLFHAPREPALVLPYHQPE